MKDIKIEWKRDYPKTACSVKWCPNNTAFVGTLNIPILGYKACIHLCSKCYRELITRDLFIKNGTKENQEKEGGD